jgi:AcrR family transcriptional regulator
MDQIAEEVGMSKRTIYELFKDKDKLVLECLEAMHSKHLLEIHEIIANTSNVIEALYMMGQHGEKKKAVINHLFFEDIRKLYPQIWDNMKTRANSGAGAISRKIFTKGIEEGVFKPDINVEIVDVFFNAMMEIFHKKEIFPTNADDKDLIKNIIIPYFIGISTEKGIKLIEQYI